MEKSVLMDKLAEYTSKYTSLLRRGGRQEEINNYERLIQQLQQEIQARRGNWQNASSYRGFNQR